MSDSILPLQHSLELTPLFRLVPVYDWHGGWLSDLERTLLKQNLQNTKEKTFQLTFSFSEKFLEKENKQPINNTYLTQLEEEIYSYLYFKANTNDSSLGYSILSQILQEQIRANLKEKINIKIQKEDKPLITATELLNSLGEQLKQDIVLLKNLTNETFKNSFNFDNFIEKEKNIFVHTNAKVSPLSSLETNENSDIIVIDENATISAFSILRAPLYIGKNTIIDKAFISNSRIGNFCRVGGEVSDTIMAPYSNKHHEGFVGHSLIGSWVNLGALTTTSDLKNNYGKIQLEFQDQKIHTNEIKFGSIMGDFVKTAIGTMLNTGTILDSGVLLFEGKPTQKYYPPFFWGGKNPACYDWHRFTKDATSIMARRNAIFDSYQEKKLQEVWHSENS